MIDAWSVVRHTHRLGSCMLGVVSSLDAINVTSDNPGGFIHLQTKSEFPALLPYHSLQDEASMFGESVVPLIGDEIETVVSNFVDGRLYLSAKPQELKISRKQQWLRYYEYIDSVNFGDKVSGIVRQVEPFGLFVDIESEFIGVIDVVHSRLAGGQFPQDRSCWPPVGSRIECRFEHPRLHNQQIGLGWSPKMVG